MKDCGFPVIPEYLGNQTFPKDSIPNAEVTHVWTQDYDLSKHIAKSSNIGTVAREATDMIGSVDAVLLARDDSENHLIHALPFLQAGIPIYIDKPLSCNLQDAQKLLAVAVWVRFDFFTASPRDEGSSRSSVMTAMLPPRMRTKTKTRGIAVRTIYWKFRLFPATQSGIVHLADGLI